MTSTTKPHFHTQPCPSCGAWTDPYDDEPWPEGGEWTSAHECSSCGDVWTHGWQHPSGAPFADDPNRDRAWEYRLHGRNAP